MTLGRREFVVGSVGTAALAHLNVSCSDGEDQTKEVTPALPLDGLPLDEQLFEHGVASGDPLRDAVIIWSRVTAAGDSHQLRWVLSSDPELKDVIKSGSVKTSAAQDFTLKVDVTGLEPGSVYYYAFSFEDRARSQIGRTRTLPDADASHVRFAFTSCANFNNGFFHAYRAIAERADLDFWLHLGDYIYEYADGAYGDTTLGRTLDPVTEAISLADYRKRYAQVRKDPDLKALHLQHPCIVVWDDHEVADNASLVGAVNHDASEGDWSTRVQAGTQAFLEWVPLRLPAASDPQRIYRSFEFGNLFDLIMIDTRLRGRDEQAGGLEDPGDPAVWSDPSRQLLGADQEDFLKQALTASRERGATWRLLGNQVMFAETRSPLSQTGAILNADAWDGYMAARQRIVTHIKENGVHNVVVLTGDIHTSWAFELAENPFDPASYDPATGKGSFAVELVGPSVTSLGLEGDPQEAIAPAVLSQFHPHLKYIDVTRKGYVLVDVQEQRVQAEWYHIGNHKQNDAAGRAEQLAKAFECVSNTARLVPVAAASPEKRAGHTG